MEPDEVIARARIETADELFLAAVMLARLCSDPIARQDRMHRVLHLGYRITEHVGPAYVAETQRSLGIADARAAWLIDLLDREGSLLPALVGAAEG